MKKLWQFLLITILGPIVLVAVFLLLVRVAVGQQDPNKMILTKSQFQKMRTMFLEEGYLRGEKDAINGKINIRWKDTSWVWIGSPWATGEPPIFEATSSITRY